MSVYLRKKDRICSQKSTDDNYINVFFKKFACLEESVSKVRLVARKAY